MIARLPLFLILSHTTAFQLHAPSKGTSFIRLDARNPSKVEDVGRGIVEEDVEEEAEFELVRTFANLRDCDAVTVILTNRFLICLG